MMAVDVFGINIACRGKRGVPLAFQLQAKKPQGPAPAARLGYTPMTQSLTTRYDFLLTTNYDFARISHMEDLIQRIYNARGNRAPKGWISVVLEGIEAAGLIVVPRESRQETKTPGNPWEPGIGGGIS